MMNILTRREKITLALSILVMMLPLLVLGLCSYTTFAYSDLKLDKAEMQDTDTLTVTVKVKWADFQQATRSRSFTGVVSSKAQLHEVSLGLIRSVFPPEKGIRLVGVTLSNFAQMNAAPSDQALPLEAAGATS